jgi:Protein of unknown function with HXXEE motif
MRIERRQSESRSAPWSEVELGGQGVRRALWLLPLAFIVHDGEEILTIPGWIARNRSVLDRFASTDPLARRIVENLAATTGAVTGAVLAELVVVLLATFAAQRRLHIGPALYAYTAVLGVFFLHSLTHVGLAATMRGYTPGVISAILVIPPVSIVVYRRLFSAGLLTWRSATLSAAAGAVLVVPAVVAAHYFGRSL